MRRVVVYSRVPCPACTATKALLTRLGVEYEEVRFDLDLDLATSLVDEGYGAAPIVKVFEGEELVDSWAGNPVRPEIKAKVEALA
jgi:glutaredoxin